MDRDHEVFVTVVEEGSLAAAGRRLRLSTAMVSKRLARLEEKLGVKLIHRTTRRCATTHIGQLFYQHMEQIVIATHEAEAIARSKAGTLAGELHIRTIASFGRLRLARFIKPFLKAHPQLRVVIDIADRRYDLIGNHIDVEITLSGPHREGFAVIPLIREQRIFCASPAYLNEMGEPKTVQDLHHHAILAATQQLPWLIKGPHGQTIFEGQSRVATNSSEMPAALAVEGLGIALPSRWAIRDELSSGRLMHILRDHESAAELHMCAVYPRSRVVSANVQAFVKHMQIMSSSFTDEIIQ